MSGNPETESESGTCADAKLADLDIPETITEYIGQSDDQKAISVTTDFRVNGSALEVKVSLPLPTYMESKITDQNTQTKKTEGTEILSSKDSGVSSSSDTTTQQSCHKSNDPVIKIVVSKSTGSQSELVKTKEIHLLPDLKWSDLKTAENQTSVSVSEKNFQTTLNRTDMLDAENQIPECDDKWTQIPETESYNQVKKGSDQNTQTHKPSSVQTDSISIKYRTQGSECSGKEQAGADPQEKYNDSEVEEKEEEEEEEEEEEAEERHSNRVKTVYLPTADKDSNAVALLYKFIDFMKHFYSINLTAHPLENRQQTPAILPCIGGSTLTSSVIAAFNKSKLPSK